MYKTGAADRLYDCGEGKPLCQPVSYQLNFTACLLPVTAAVYFNTLRRFLQSNRN